MPRESSWSHCHIRLPAQALVEARALQGAWEGSVQGSLAQQERLKVRRDRNLILMSSSRRDRTRSSAEHPTLGQFCL